MFKDAFLVGDKYFALKKRQATVRQKKVKLIESFTQRQGLATLAYHESYYKIIDDVRVLQLEAMAQYFDSFLKRPKQTISVVFDGNQSIGEINAENFKANILKVKAHLEKKGFKTKLKAEKRSEKPKYRLTISTRENFR